MKSLTIAGVVGLLFAMVIIYWLSPLNNGAVALVIIVCTGVTSAIAKMFYSNPKDRDND
ncbi:hypothetical protein [Pseudoalteromonas ostreae]|uniref:hypothetical protein n=1 Tax=Pseudoalteromonas ostreae TaxID=2774154 RepID=UPI001B35BB6D|nr:hypothetical protein [Pseudoalteromonas ostreae]